MAKYSNYLFKLDLLILSVLKRRDLYGYELSKIIAEETHNYIIPKHGTMYPVIYRLIEEQCISSYTRLIKNKARVYYHIESKGEKYLQQLKEQIREYDDTTYEIMIDNFGEPIDVVKAYYDTINSNYLLKRISIKRIIILTCITILSITAVYFAYRTYYLNEATNEYYNSIPNEIEESIEVIEG